MSDAEPADTSPSDDLAGLLARLVEAEPQGRIDLRAAVLAHGAQCIGPLLDTVGRHPTLVSTVASWLAFLAASQPETLTSVRAALTSLATRPDGDIARQALGRLGGAPRPKRTRSAATHRGKSAACEVVHGRLIEFARQGRTVMYSDLETSRGHIGHYLHAISLEEAAAGRPPLNSIVVSKTTQRPGDGFIPAMVEVGFASPHEDLEDVWQRATAAVFAYWREHRQAMP
jgi:hypothetical protein